MQSSIILAHAFGMYFVVLSIAMVVNKKFFKEGINAISHDKGLRLVTSIMPLLVGSFLVAWHNVWIQNWTVIVTVICWLVFLVGALRLLVPHLPNKAAKFVSHKNTIVAIAIVLFIVGLFLLYHCCYLPSDSMPRHYR